eukprot:4837449-Pleurochrysis_carterae.AAC.1
MKVRRACRRPYELIPCVLVLIRKKLLRRGSSTTRARPISARILTNLVSETTARWHFASARKAWRCITSFLNGTSQASSTRMRVSRSCRGGQSSYAFTEVDIGKHGARGYSRSARRPSACHHCSYPFAFFKSPPALSLLPLVLDRCVECCSSPC